jgi:hypothetical protein
LQFVVPALLLCPLVLALEVALAGRPAPARISVIDGIVTDIGLAPLPDAEIAVVSSLVRVRTAPDGRFRIPDLSSGIVILIVRRIGFFPTSMIVRLPESGTVHVSFALTRATQEVDAVTVIGERGDSLRLLEFEYRWRHGFGKYLNRQEIGRKRGARTADLLAFLGMPLVMVRGDDGQVKRFVGSVGSVFELRTSGADSASSVKSGKCEPRVFVNGVALPAPVDTDDLPRPGELAGLEVYAKAPPPIPLQYGGLSACGKVSMLWTTVGR